MTTPRLTKLVLDQQQLDTRYQPIVDCRSAGLETVKVECLIRGPKGTNLHDPRVMFEYARRRHFESTLDLLAFRIFLHDLSWVCDLPFTINMHAATLSRDCTVAAEILTMLKANNLRPNLLHIELVEAAPELDEELLRTNLAELRRAGVRIALDDFGTAHANLHLLDVVRPEIIKIDRSLLPEMPPVRDVSSCFLAAVKCAKTVGAEVVAEGIETAEQLTYIRELGVDYGQGYYFARPLDLNGLQQWLWACSAIADPTETEAIRALL